MKYRNLFLSFLVFTFLLSCSKDDTTTNPITDNILTVKIGNQVWMTKNLDVDHYRNGEPIRHCQTEEDWADASNKQEGAWCYYYYNSDAGKVFGKLYNFYAVADYRGLAPIGWHVPSDTEWTEIENYLGGSDVAGGKLKSSGTLAGADGFWSINIGATNSSGFSALPGGFCFPSGDFNNIYYCGYWWSSSEDSTYDSMDEVFYRSLSCNNTEVARFSSVKSRGKSVRCVKD